MSEMTEPITMPAMAPDERPEGLLPVDDPVDEDELSVADLVNT